MKKNKIINKKRLLITVTILLIIIIIVIISKMPKDNLKYNRNKTFTKTQEVEGIEFKNIKCTYDGKDSIISYTMINKTKKEIYLNNYDVIVKDKNNVILSKIKAQITKTLSPNKSIDMANQVVGVDLTEASYMELVLNTEKEE